jgi:hypothetical protein
MSFTANKLAINMSSITPVTGYWTNVQSTSNLFWSSIDYGNSKFVSIGFGWNKAAYSTDGTSWTEVEMPNYGWDYISYGNGVFVAINTNLNLSGVSTDGINWNTYSLPVLPENPYQFWTGISFGNGVFVIISSSNKAAWSSNGINWNSVTIPTPSSLNTWKGIKYVGSLFIAIQNGESSAYLTTTNGASWTSRSFPLTKSWFDVGYGNGMIVALPDSDLSNSALYSSNGINWSQTTTGSYLLYPSVTYGNGRFMLVSGSGAYYSLDGVTWVSCVEPLIYKNEKYIFYGAGRFLVGTNGYYAYSKLPDELPPAPYWDPYGLSSLTFWHDAADTTSVSVSSGRAVYVADKGGNNYDLSVIFSTKLGPFYGARKLNSMNVFEWSKTSANTDQVLQNNSFSYNQANTPLNIFMVVGFDEDQIPLDQDYLFAGTNIFTNRIEGRRTVQSGVQLFSITPEASPSIATPENYVPEQSICIIGFQINGANSRIRVNGSNSPNAFGDIGSQQFYSLYIGCNYAGSQSLDGFIAEIIGFPNISEQEIVEGYLAWKWGIQGLLPYGHPYKNSPPQ